MHGRHFYLFFLILDAPRIAISISILQYLPTYLVPRSRSAGIDPCISFRFDLYPGLGDASSYNYNSYPEWINCISSSLHLKLCTPLPYPPPNNSWPISYLPT
ncbi:hypothetical protein DFH27DRAFT_551301 [Peziza echinospora]|nr:hypothetical protein DFH27DRAFT_551301 [Peziza echinospora]